MLEEYWTILIGNNMQGWTNLPYPLGEKDTMYPSCFFVLNSVKAGSVNILLMNNSNAEVRGALTSAFISTDKRKKTLYYMNTHIHTCSLDFLKMNHL